MGFTTSMLVIRTNYSTPDYPLVPSPATLTIPAGTNATDTITVVPSNGWSSSVAVSATSATSGIIASMGTSPVAVNGTSTLTVNVASSVAPGSYSVTVNGMSGSQAGQNNHSINIPVTVTGGGGTPDFTLSANPASVTVPVSGSGTTTITVNPINGFTGSVALSASGLPSGVTAGFSPASTTTTSVLTLTADATAVAGTYPITVTGVSGSLTHTVAVSVMVTTSGGGGSNAPDYVAAYATSATSIRVYFNPVQSASQYNIYRATASGSYDFSHPVGQVAVSSGNEHFFDDSNLTTGQDYYYVVKAVVGGVESAVSEEDTHYPNAAAIPWNGSSNSILQASLSDLNTEPDLPFSIPPTNSLVMAPDSLVYSDDGTQVSPSNTTVDTTNWLMIVKPEGNLPSYDSPLVGLNFENISAPPPGAAKSMGPFRRVRTDPGFDGVSGVFYIPQYTSGLVNLNYPNIAENMPTTHETAYTYVGFTGDGLEIDAGVTFYPATEPGVTPPLPNRWQPYLLVVDGNRSGRTALPGVSLDMKARALSDAHRKAYIDAMGGDALGNNVFVALFLNPDKKMCRMYVFGVDDKGYYLARDINAAGKFKLDRTDPIRGRKIRAKRVIALAQSLKAASTFTGKYFSNKLNDEPRESAKQYAETNSVFKGVTFQKARKWQGYSPSYWTASTPQGADTNNYAAKPCVTTSGTGQETGLDDGRTGETANIKASSTGP